MVRLAGAELLVWNYCCIFDIFTSYKLKCGKCILDNLSQITMALAAGATAAFNLAYTGAVAVLAYIDVKKLLIHGLNALEGTGWVSIMYNTLEM